MLSVPDAVARNPDGEGAATMSRCEMADRARCGVRTVASVLSVCRARGYLKRDRLRRQPGSATRWRPATWRFASWIYEGQAFSPLLSTEAVRASKLAMDDDALAEALTVLERLS